MNKIKFVFLFLILFCFVYLHLYYGRIDNSTAKDSIKLKILYESSSDDTLKVSYWQLKNTISKIIELSSMYSEKGEVKTIDITLPRKYTFAHLYLNFGKSDLKKNNAIRACELSVGDNKIIYKGASLLWFIKQNDQLKLNHNGKIICSGNTVYEDIVFKTVDLRGVIAKYEIFSNSNVIYSFVIAFISAMILSSGMFFIYRNLSIFKKKKNINIKVISIGSFLFFVLLNVLIIYYYSGSKSNVVVYLKSSDSLASALATDDSVMYQQFEHNPQINLLYNGNFEDNFMFWKVQADSTEVSLISTPYGNGVRITRTDGDGRWWPFRYNGRPILYHKNHTYEVSFYCRVLSGDDLPFNIGWWILDENKTRSPANLKKDVTAQQNGWFYVQTRYKFKEYFEDPVFFLNSLKDFSIVEVADIKLIDLDYTETMQYYK